MNLKPIYTNGLVIWDENQIRLRNQICEDFSTRLEAKLRDLNFAWRFYRIEAPTLIPDSKISSEYEEGVYFKTQVDAEPEDTLCLAPETTQSTYDYVVSRINEKSFKLPLCVWQLRKSYRNEQDKTLKHLRFKEFYQLEFQFIYSNSSKADYVGYITEAVKEITSFWIKDINYIPSDRLPYYSKETNDINAVLPEQEIEIVSLSQRKDSPILDTENFEIAVGIDRLVSILS